MSDISDTSTVTEYSAMKALRAFSQGRDALEDTVLASGNTVESVLDELVQRHLEDENERAEHSWIWNIYDEFRILGVSPEHLDIKTVKVLY
ncbi:hypothetical protein HDU81_005420 [Chytriomyces hyalinus]|nr:hypothetical protein HDU81_005420 [Chytriomyces hyalinus]